jgi:pimeloyl-ACP methyl ester carboxylesterase
MSTAPPAHPPRRPLLRRPLVVALLVVAALLLVVVAVGAWLVLKRPLTLERWAAVAELEKAGLERVAVPTRTGDLAVWSGGHGAAGEPPLVLLHGAGDHAGAWGQVAAALAAEHRLVVPDLPGHGDSEPADGPLPMATVLGGVVELLSSDAVRADGAAPPVIVGNSLGGWLALLVGARHPELASRLVVVNGGATEGPVDPGVLLPESGQEAGELLDLLGAPGPFPAPVLADVARNVQEGALSRFMASDDLPDHALTGRLGEVAVPVDLVWGELDGYFPLTYAEATTAALPAARLSVVDDCGHVPQRYCPGRFVDVLARVLAAPPPQARPEAKETAGDGGGEVGEEAAP